MKLLSKQACSMLFLASAVFGQTLHDDDKGGTNQTVTVYTKSRTHLDEGLLLSGGVTLGDGSPVVIGDKQIWQHGHPGPRILRVILPGKGNHGKSVTGFQLEEGDVIEIPLVNPNKGGESLGVMTLSRSPKPGIGLLTSGHAQLAGIPSLLPCIPECQACGRRETQERSCPQIKTAIDSAVADAKSDFVWVFEVEKSFPLRWVPKSPASVESVRQIVAANLPTPVRFDFALENAGNREAVAMTDLRVKRGTGSVWSTPMPKFSRFQVCAGDEKTNKPLCDPLPECDSFWKRHFNHGCKVYGGTGVLRNYDPKKHKEHSH